MDVTVLQEVIERNVPPNIKDNPTEIRAYVSRELDTIRGVIAGLSARDAFVHSDAITAEIINDKNPSAGLQIERVIDILDNQNQAALKVMPAVVGKSSTGQVASTEEIGREAGRGRVWQYVGLSVVRVYIKKKQKKHKH